MSQRQLLMSAESGQLQPTALREPSRAVATTDGSCGNLRNLPYFSHLRAKARQVSEQTLEFAPQISVPRSPNCGPKDAGHRSFVPRRRPTDGPAQSNLWWRIRPGTRANGRPRDRSARNSTPKSDDHEDNTAEWSAADRDSFQDPSGSSQQCGRTENRLRAPNVLHPSPICPLGSKSPPRTVPAFAPTRPCRRQSGGRPPRGRHRSGKHGRGCGRRFRNDPPDGAVQRRRVRAALPGCGQARRRCPPIRASRVPQPVVRRSDARHPRMWSESRVSPRCARRYRGLSRHNRCAHVVACGREQLVDCQRHPAKQDGRDSDHSCDGRS